MADLKEEEKDLTTQKKTLESNIASYKQIIENATNTIANHEESLAKAKSTLARTIAHCQKLLKIFNDTTAERTRELKIIDKII